MNEERLAINNKPVENAVNHVIIRAVNNSNESNQWKNQYIQVKRACETICCPAVLSRKCNKSQPPAIRPGERAQLPRVAALFPT